MGLYAGFARGGGGEGATFFEFVRVASREALSRAC